MIAAAPRIPNGDSFDIAGKGFGEGNVKLGRSPGVRKDEKLRWLPSHVATIQSLTCPPRHYAAVPVLRGNWSGSCSWPLKSCEKAKKLLSRFARTQVRRFVYRDRRKSLTISPPPSVAIALGEVHPVAQLS